MRNNKTSREQRTITTVKPHYIGTESMVMAFERAFLIINQQKHKQPDNPPCSKNN